jgi:hypothetical protein
VCFDREGLGTDSARKLAANILVWAARNTALARPAPMPAAAPAAPAPG